MKSKIRSRRFNSRPSDCANAMLKCWKADGAVLDKCTTTIIQQVVELKNLVNEFSQFARLPSAQLVPNDLNADRP